MYTPLALRDWFRAAPRNPLTTSPLLDITPCHLNMMNNGMLLIRSFPASMTFVDLMAKVTEDNLHAPVDSGPPVGREAL